MMLTYIFFYLTVFSLLWLNTKNTKNFFFGKIAFIMLFIMSALRFDVGWDYGSYYNLIQKNIEFYDAQLGRLEPLNQLLIKISQYFEFTQFYFITTSLIICFYFYRTLKNYSSNFAVSSLLFLSLPIFFFSSLAIIRQFTALAIVFYAFRYVESRQLFKFLICLTIATLFHKSAIIAFPLFYLFLWKPHVSFFPIIYILGFFSSDLLYWLVENLLPQYLKYLDKSIGEGGDKVLILFQLLGLFFLFFINRLKEQKNLNNFYFIAFFIGLFVWSSLAKYGHAGFRGGLYYIVFCLLLIPNIIIEIKQNKLILEITYAVCFFFFLLTLYLGNMNPKKDPNMPYQTFFFKDKFDLETSK